MFCVCKTILALFRMKCSIRLKVIRNSHIKYQCKCGNLCHALESMGKHTNTWLCYFCLAVEFLFNHILNDDELQLTMNIFCS